MNVSSHFCLFPCFSLSLSPNPAKLSHLSSQEVLWAPDISCYCSQREGDNKTQPAATSGIFRSFHNNTTTTPAHCLHHKPGAYEGKPTAALKLSLLTLASFLKRRNCFLHLCQKDERNERHRISSFLQNTCKGVTGGVSDPDQYCNDMMTWLSRAVPLYLNLNVRQITPSQCRKCNRLYLVLSSRRLQ